MRGPWTVQITVIRLINLLIINVELSWMSTGNGKWEDKLAAHLRQKSLLVWMNKEIFLFCFAEQEITHVFVVQCYFCYFVAMYCLVQG